MLTDKPTLYGDRISGNCLKTLWTANLCDFAHEWIDIDIMKGESRTDEFLQLSSAGQVPILRLASGDVIEQSDAIILYMAETTGSDLIPSDPILRAQMYAWLFWEQYSHETAIAVRRFRVLYQKKEESEIEPNLLPKGYAALDRMEAVLTHAPFILGESFSLADIALVAYTRVAHEGGFDLSAYPHLRAWIGRCENRIGLPHSQETT